MNRYVQNILRAKFPYKRKLVLKLFARFFRYFTSWKNSDVDENIKIKRNPPEKLTQ